MAKLVDDKQKNNTSKSEDMDEHVHSEDYKTDL